MTKFYKNQMVRIRISHTRYITSFVDEICPTGIKFHFENKQHFTYFENATDYTEYQLSIKG